MPDKVATKPAEVAESAIDLSKLTPQQLMEAAALARKQEEENERELDQMQREAYLKSPQGQMERELLQKTPKFSALGVSGVEDRGGFHNTLFNIRGLPASLVHCWVPKDTLHDWREYWRPVEPERVTMWEGEEAQGKLFVRSFEVRNRMVEFQDHILMVADRSSIEGRTASRVDGWNARFKARAPDGKNEFETQTDAGRVLTVNSESYGFRSNRVDAGA